MYNFSLPEYKACRNELVELVIFEDDKRVLSYGGLNYKTAIEECLFHTRLGRDIMIFPYPLKINGKVNTLTKWNKSEIKEIALHHKKEFDLAKTQKA